METLKNQLNKRVFNCGSNRYDSDSLVSKQFKEIKNNSSKTSKALQKELDKSIETFKKQWNHIKKP